jgi:hypothetical protein
MSKVFKVIFSKPFMLKIFVLKNYQAKWIVIIKLTALSVYSPD